MPGRGIGGETCCSESQHLERDVVRAIHNDVDPGLVSGLHIRFDHREILRRLGTSTVGVVEAEVDAMLPIEIDVVDGEAVRAHSYIYIGISNATNISVNGFSCVEYFVVNDKRIGSVVNVESEVITAGDVERQVEGEVSLIASSEDSLFDFNPYVVDLASYIQIKPRGVRFF